MPDETFRNKSALIKQWIREQRGHRWSYQQLDHDLLIDSLEARNLRRGVVKELCDVGEIERIPRLQGIYRTVEGSPVALDWQHIDNPVVPLNFPFGLENYVKLTRKAIVVLAGGKDSGKTAYLNGIVLANMWHPLGVDLYYNGEGDIKERLYSIGRSMGIEIPNPAPFRVFERMDAFDQVIDPDRISVIDYLNVGSEFYLIGDEIDKIFKKLKRGVAIIGLQKPTVGYTFIKGKKTKVPRDLGIGGASTSYRAQLYLSLDGNKYGGKLQIVHAKGRADRKVNPVNKMWSYQFDEDGCFTNIAEFQEAEDEEI